jgi:hypothetical protein
MAIRSFWGAIFPIPVPIMGWADSVRSGSPLHVGVWLLARADHELEVEGRENAEQLLSPPALP